MSGLGGSNLFVPVFHLRSDAATRPTPSVFVVSHHLDGFLHTRVAGLLHPAASPEVQRVWPACSLRPTREGCFVPRPLPRDAGPFRAFPSLPAFPASPRSLPSCRCRRSAFLRSQRTLFPGSVRPSCLRPWSTPGLCSISESVASPDRFRPKGARCSLGLRCSSTSPPSPSRVPSAGLHRSYVNVKERSELSSRLTPGCLPECQGESLQMSCQLCEYLISGTWPPTRRIRGSQDLSTSPVSFR